MSTGPTEPITLEKIYDLLQIMQGRMDALESRQRDTTPSWVTVLTDEIHKVKRELTDEIRAVKREVAVIHHELLPIKAGLLDLEERVERLEGKN